MNVVHRSAMRVSAPNWMAEDAVVAAIDDETAHRIAKEEAEFQAMREEAKLRLAAAIRDEEEQAENTIRADEIAALLGQDPAAIRKRADKLKIRGTVMLREGRWVRVFTEDEAEAVVRNMPAWKLKEERPS